MAEIDIIGGIISEKAERQLDAVLAKTEKVVEAIKGMNTIIGGAGGAGRSSNYDAAIKESAKLQAKLAEMQVKEKADKEKHFNDLRALEAKNNAALLAEKTKHENAMSKMTAKYNNDEAKSKEKLNAKLFELELKINSASQVQKEKYEQEALKLQQDFNNKIILEKNRLSSKLKVIEDKENARAQRAANSAARGGTAAQGKINPLNSQNIVDNSNQNMQLKLAAVAASQYTTQLQKLDAQIRQLAIDMDSKFNPELREQSQEYRNLYAQQSKLKENYQRLSRATGQMGSSSKSAYGSFFQMTQVMREMPNFAIDARIGFMALSNNLPMLADEFRAVKQTIIDTEGAVGAGAKTWKALGKSLLSLNTIMIVVSTFLVLFGDDIVDFFTTLAHGPAAIDRTAESLKALIAVTKDYDGQASDTISKITALGIQIDKFGGKAEHADTIVAEFNKTFGTHLETIEDVRKAYPDMAKAAISAAMRMQASMSLIKKGSDALLDAQNARLELTKFKKEDVDKAYNIGTEIAEKAEEFGYSKEKMMEDLLAGEGFKSVKKAVVSKIATLSEKADMQTMGYTLEGNPEIKAAHDATIATKDAWLNLNNLIIAFNALGNGKEIVKLTTQLGKSKKKVDLFTKEATSLAEPIKPTKDDDDKDKTTVQDGTDMLVDAQFYSSERAMLVAKAANEEKQIQEATTEGIIQSFALREKAALAYQLTILKIAVIDNDIAEKEIADKLENDLTQLKSTQENNLKLHEEGKITSERMLELNAQFVLAEKTLKDNAEIAQLERKDAFDKKAIELEYKTQATILSIKQQSYARQAEMIDTTVSGEINKVDTKGASNAANISKQSTHDIIQKVTGGTNYGDNIALLENERKTEHEKSIIAQNGIKMKLGIVAAGSEEERKLRLELQKEQEADAKKGDDYAIKREIEMQKIKEDLQIQTVENIIAAMHAVTDAFFEWQAEMVDKQLAIDTKIQDERVSQYEDETKAGMHTAEELDNVKKRSADYQTSLDEEAARKKAELEKQQFLLGQAMASGQIWINYAINAVKAGANPPLQAWMLASAIAAQTLVLAQTIPAFAEGGDMVKDGRAILGDGGKHELVVDPRGNFFLSDNKAGVYDLKAGSHIFPDINKLEIENVLGLKKSSTSNNEQKMNELSILKSIDKAIKTQKQGNFYGMPLVRQLNNSERYMSRRRGLMN